VAWGIVVVEEEGEEEGKHSGASMVVMIAVKR